MKYDFIFQKNEKFCMEFKRKAQCHFAEDGYKIPTDQTERYNYPILQSKNTDNSNCHQQDSLL